MMSDFRRPNFFPAGWSPRHIGGGRSSATAVELASYHRDEIQSAGLVLPEKMRSDFLPGLWGLSNPIQGESERFAKGGQGPFGGIGFRGLERGVVHLTG